MVIIPLSFGMRFYANECNNDNHLHSHDDFDLSDLLVIHHHDCIHNNDNSDHHLDDSLHDYRHRIRCAGNLHFGRIGGGL